MLHALQINLLGPHCNWKNFEHTVCTGGAASPRQCVVLCCIARAQFCTVAALLAGVLSAGTDAFKFAAAAAAACCSLHVRTYNVCQVSVCWHARSAVAGYTARSLFRLCRLLYSYAGAGPLFPCCVPPFRRCRLAAEPARQHTAAALPLQTRTARSDPSFCRVPQLRLRALTFCFLGPPLQICQGKKKKNRLLEFTCTLSLLLPFSRFFLLRDRRKMILEIVLASVR